jgi:glycosyltransferase involved in cell wall biosynthesis
MAVAGEGQAAALVRTASCGEAVPRGDAEGLAQAIVSIWSLPGPERDRLGALGRAWVVDNAAWDAVAERILAAFRNATGGA